VVVAGDPGADLPADAAVDLDLQGEVPRRDVLGEGAGEVGRERHVGAGEHRRPDVDVAVALVHRRQRRGQRHLLVLVRRVRVQAVVVHAHAAVRVARGEGHLQRGGERAGGGGAVVGEVQLPERRVLEVEARVRGAEHEVDDERDDAHDGGQRQERVEQAPAPLPEVVVGVLAAVLASLPHGTDLASFLAFPFFSLWEVGVEALGALCVAFEQASRFYYRSSLPTTDS
jgi:hypothetical protein